MAKLLDNDKVECPAQTGTVNYAACVDCPAHIKTIPDKRKIVCLEDTKED
jgi:hypothetical protein